MAQYRLTANKTKFYNLAKVYWPEIESRKNVNFVKYARCCDYGLDFSAGGYYHRLFLSVFGGKALLGDSWSTYDADGTEVNGWECHELSLAELRTYGLLEEVS